SDGIPCPDAMYYDIKTTATYPTDGSGNALSPIEVCVRRKFTGPNALGAYLQLGHYNDHANPPAWEVLAPPPGMDPVIDCGLDLQACGCADEASCGIDLDAGVDVFMLCGMTTSFSPFAILKSPI